MRETLKEEISDLRNLCDSLNAKAEELVPTEINPSEALHDPIPLSESAPEPIIHKLNARESMVADFMKSGVIFYSSSEFLLEDTPKQIEKLDLQIKKSNKKVINKLAERRQLVKFLFEYNKNPIPLIIYKNNKTGKEFSVSQDTFISLLEKGIIEKRLDIETWNKENDLTGIYYLSSVPFSDALEHIKNKKAKEE